MCLEERSRIAKLLKLDCDKVVLVNLLHTFRNLFCKNTWGTAFEQVLSLFSNNKRYKVVLLFLIFDFETFIRIS